MAKTRKRIDGQILIRDFDLGEVEEREHFSRPLSPEIIESAFGESEIVEGFIRDSRQIHRIADVRRF